MELSDARTISAPLAWFPRLVHGSGQEWGNWRLIGRGHGIHREDLDEDICVEGLLAERPSGESQASLEVAEGEVGSHDEAVHSTPPVDPGEPSFPAFDAPPRGDVAVSRMTRSANALVRAFIASWSMASRGW